jgi:hypothetical protein
VHVKEIREIVLKVIAQQSKFEANELKDELHLEKDLDLIDHHKLDVQLAIEDKLGDIRLDSDTPYEWETVGDVVDAYCSPKMGICCDCGEEKPILPDLEPTVICKDCFQKRVECRFSKDIAEAIRSQSIPNPIIR